MTKYRDPTPMQRRVLSYITEMIRNNGRPPTYQEITTQFHWKSTNAARGHVRLLINKGLLAKESGLARGMKLPGKIPGHIELKEIPLIGKVTAGIPIEAIENWDSTIGIDASIFPEEEMFALRVKGDSMIRAGIRDGDIALVRQTQDVKEGDIIVALVDGESTMKRYLQMNGLAVLRPENPDFRDMVVSKNSDFSISGVVVGIIRRLPAVSP